MLSVPTPYIFLTFSGEMENHNHKVKIIILEKKTQSSCFIVLEKQKCFLESKYLKNKLRSHSILNIVMVNPLRQNPSYSKFVSGVKSAKATNTPKGYVRFILTH